MDDSSVGVLSSPSVLSVSLLSKLNDESLAWEALHPGIDIHRLYVAPDGASAALLRYQPGASLPRHRHVGMEHIYILRGSQYDENGTHPAGSLLVHFPGTEHAVRSASGCIALAIWQKPVVFLD